MNLQKLIRIFRAGKGFDQEVLTKKVNITAVGKGSCTANFEVDEDTCDNEGFLAPSYVATVFDTVTSLGVMTLHNKVHVSVNIHMSYFKPAKLGEEIVISSQVIKSGKSMVYLEGTLMDKKSGDVIAKGTHVKYVIDKKLYD